MDAAKRLSRGSGRTRILVVDPDATIRNWIAPSIHSRLGAELVQLNTGDELFDNLQSEPPDLVITNASLPGQTGLQVLARCRAKGNTTPFIVYTSFQDDCMRVFVSDADGTVLSSRVVDATALALLAASLVDGQTEIRPRHSARPRVVQPGADGE